MDPFSVQPEQWFSPDEDVVKVINDDGAKMQLRTHIGKHGRVSKMPASNPALECVPTFFIERAPHNFFDGSKCKLPSCCARIPRNQYRVALTPGMAGPAWAQSMSMEPSKCTFLRAVCFW